MITSILRYNGLTQQARAELVPLLREVPQVTFRERTLAEYEVTADDRTVLQALGSGPAGASPAVTDPRLRLDRAGELASRVEARSNT